MQGEDKQRQETVRNFMAEFSAYLAEKTAGERCDDCQELAPTFEVAGKRLCAKCIAPPLEALQRGVIFDGTRVFAVDKDHASEIKPDA